MSSGEQTNKKLSVLLGEDRQFNSCVGMLYVFTIAVCIVGALIVSKVTDYIMDILQSLYPLDLNNKLHCFLSAVLQILLNTFLSYVFVIFGISDIIKCKNSAEILHDIRLQIHFAYTLSLTMTFSQSLQNKLELIRRNGVF